MKGNKVRDRQNCNANGPVLLIALLLLMANPLLYGQALNPVDPPNVPTPADQQQPQKLADPQQTTVPTENTQVSPQAASDDYLIGPDDMLNILVLDVPELSRVYRVSGAGKVMLPLLSNPLPAAGINLREFSASVAKELKAAGLVSNPQVTTSVEQSRLHTVAITGAVKTPQIYPVFSQTTLLDVLSQAGGLTEDAANTALVHRGDIAMHILAPEQQTTAIPEQSEQMRTTIIDVKKLLESGDHSLNVPVYPGDRITIPRAGIVYVVGAVNKPGGFAIRSGTRETTVLQAIALAENPNRTARASESVIIRSDASAPGGHTRIPINLKDVLGGKVPDPGLRAEDVLFVPDSAGKRALHRTIDSILQVTTGVAIYSARF
jgi:polysaccharide biosynthesis/export protein